MGGTTILRVTALSLHLHSLMHKDAALHSWVSLIHLADSDVSGLAAVLNIQLPEVVQLIPQDGFAAATWLCVLNRNGAPGKLGLQIERGPDDYGGVILLVRHSS